MQAVLQIILITIKQSLKVIFFCVYSKLLNIATFVHKSLLLILVK